jgi:hypothetical protein
MKFAARSTAIAFASVAAVFLCIGLRLSYAYAQSAHIEEVVEAHGPSSRLELTPGQRNAIYQEVHKELSKVAPSRFATDIGADVPPIIELYTLPGDILASNPKAQRYKFTEVDDQVVVVDPTTMRVITVIGPKAKD